MKDMSIPFNADAFPGKLKMLMEAANAGKEDEIRTWAEGVVTTYHHAGKHGSEYKGEALENKWRLPRTKKSEK